MMGRLRDSKWVYVLFSVVLAVIFWFYVRAEQDPAQTSWFYNIPVEITGESVLTRQGLTVASLSADVVNLRIEAPASVQDGLSRNRKEMRVVVDVSKCVAGENKLTFTPKWPANVNVDKITTLDREPEGITVTVEKLYTKTFQVEFQLKGRVAKGYQAGTPAVSPETVIVSGSVDQVSQVAKVVAILEDDHLDELFAGDLPLTLLDRNGDPLTDLDVTLDSDSAYVVLPVVVVRDLPLSVNFIAGGGATVDDIKYEIEPQSITVSGSESDLNGLSELYLGSVDLSKVVGTSTLTFPISLDPSLENVSGVTSATVTVTVSGLATRTFDVENIKLTNIPDGYKAAAVTKVRTVVVRGKEEDLASIDASQLSIVVDMSGVSSEGTYSLSADQVKVYLNAGSTVGVIGDYPIVVNVTR